MPDQRETARKEVDLKTERWTFRLRWQKPSATYNQATAWANRLRREEAWALQNPWYKAWKGAASEALEYTLLIMGLAGGTPLLVALGVTTALLSLDAAASLGNVTDAKSLLWWIAESFVGVVAASVLKSKIMSKLNIQMLGKEFEVVFERFLDIAIDMVQEFFKALGDGQENRRTQ